MKWMVLQFVVAVALIQSALAASVVRYDFNDMVDGPIVGQKGWSVYEMVKDSSAFSVMAEVGTSEEATDRALIVRAADVPIRCVTGEPVRWLTGQSLKVEFDFRIAVDPLKLAENKPVMVMYLGNLLLNEKVRWEVRLEATPNGDWELLASLPDEASKVIYAEKLLIRSTDNVVVSDWHQFVIEIDKLNEPDSFKSSVKILDKTGLEVAALECTDSNKGNVTMAMWNLSRLHVGFYSDKDIYGLSCIDNLTIVAK